MQIDSNGSKLWDRTFGGKNRDTSNIIIQAKNGNYIIAGYTASSGAGKKDGLLLQLDLNGRAVW